MVAKAEAAAIKPDPIVAVLERIAAAQEDAAKTAKASLALQEKMAKAQIAYMVVQSENIAKGCAALCQIRDVAEHRSTRPQQHSAAPSRKT